MVCQLRVLPALTKDVSSVPITSMAAHTGLCNTSPGDPSGFWGIMHKHGTHTCM